MRLLLAVLSRVLGFDEFDGNGASSSLTLHRLRQWVKLVNDCGCDSEDECDGGDDEGGGDDDDDEDVVVVAVAAVVVVAHGMLLLVFV